MVHCRSLICDGTLTGSLAGCGRGMAVGWLTSPLVLRMASLLIGRVTGAGGRGGAACGGTRGMGTPLASAPAGAPAGSCCGLAGIGSTLDACGRGAGEPAVLGSGAPVASSRGGLVRSLAVRPPWTGAGSGSTTGCGFPGCGADMGGGSVAAGRCGIGSGCGSCCGVAGRGSVV
jgi:hypothetical protein